MAEPAQTRRSVLKALILSALGAAGAWRFLTPRSTARVEAAVSVPARDVPGQGALVLPEDRCAIVRDGDQLLAVDLTCTHLGCTVTGTSDGFACPCHGSRFASDGEVVRGPSTRCLKRLAVEQREDRIHVYRA